LHFPYTSKDLFAVYIRIWKTIKYKASGWPDDIDRKEYLRLLRDNEGIVLQEADIQENLALRTLAKMMLNSLWGKFGIRLDVINRLTRFVTNSHQLSRIFESGKYSIQAANLINVSFPRIEEVLKRFDALHI
jgi:hypothetical protein